MTLFHGIDLEDNNVKASLISLTPYVMARDIDGLVTRFKTLDPVLQAALVDALNQLNDLTVEILEQIDPETDTPDLDAENWPNEI